MDRATRPDDAPASQRRRFRRTLVGVMAMQLAALLLLLLLQLRYGG